MLFRSCILYGVRTRELYLQRTMKRWVDDFTLFWLMQKHSLWNPPIETCHQMNRTMQQHKSFKLWYHQITSATYNARDIFSFSRASLCAGTARSPACSTALNFFISLALSWYANSTSCHESHIQQQFLLSASAPAATVLLFIDTFFCIAQGHVSKYYIQYHRI